MTNSTSIENTETEDTLPAEYDTNLLKNGVRGKYYARMQEGSNIVLLAPDVSAEFHTAEAVNEALRDLIKARKIA